MTCKVCGHCGGDCLDCSGEGSPWCKVCRMHVDDVVINYQTARDIVAALGRAGEVELMDILRGACNER